jgi:signal transduction histidine kinase
MKQAQKDLDFTQAQLLESEKLASIGQLAAGVAHEINNPIGFISNNLEMLATYIDDYNKILGMYDVLMTAVQQGDLKKARSEAEDIKSFSKDIDLNYITNDLSKLFDQTQKGVERVEKIVKDLRIFAREDINAMSLFKVEEVIDSVLSIVYNELTFKADLKKTYAQTPIIKGSPQRLGQVFINLLVNAADSIDKKGMVEIKTYVKDKNVCVDIKDTGKGIKKEYLNKIFDPFFTTKPVGQGTGLGLSVAYEIVKKYGGRIKVQSKEGEGSTFTVFLPIPQGGESWKSKN